MTDRSAVYKLQYAEGFEWLLPAYEPDIERLQFDGKPMADSWKPVQMRRLRVSDKGRELKPTDFPACSGGDLLITSAAAKDKIGSNLEQYGELLPLGCDEGKFWSMNVTCFVDALDESTSQVLRASDTGVVLMIRKHVFRPAQIGQADIFKLPQTPRGLIYATAPFVDLIRNSGLTGLEFVPVWAPN